MTINQEQREVLTVYWSGMYDDFGIWKVNIYKNGELLTYRYPTRRENGMAMYPNSFYDARLWTLRTKPQLIPLKYLTCARQCERTRRFHGHSGKCSK